MPEADLTVSINGEPVFMSEANGMMLVPSKPHEREATIAALKDALDFMTAFRPKGILGVVKS